MNADTLLDTLDRNPTSAPAATILIRAMAGGVFLSEGVLKFVYANQGVGRFTKIGIPYPALTAHSIGIYEIAGGLMLLAGLFTRLNALLFVGEMIVAILTTKISLYLGTSPLPLPPSPPQIGFWAVMHETRSDYAQLLTCLFLMMVGPGKYSLDWMISRKRSRSFKRNSSHPSSVYDRNAFAAVP